LVTDNRAMRDWKRFAAPAALSGLALAVRATTLFGASGLPAFRHHRLDALLYHTAGQTVAGGDWGMGREVLHMSPLYTYFVGVVYALFGDGPWPVRILQLAFGVGTVALIYLTALRVLPRRWAVLPGLCAALYGPMAFYETHLLVASVATFLHALLLWLTLSAMDRPETDRAAWVGVGLVWGLCCLARPTALLLVLPLGVAAGFGADQRSLAPAARRLALGCAAAALVIAPFTLRNLLVAGELVLITDSGGLNFYLGNGPGAHGSFRIPQELPGATNAQRQFGIFRAAAEQALQRPLSSRQVDAYWYGRTWQAIVDEPVAWLRLLLEKAWLFWNGREPPNTYDYAFNREVNPMLAVAPVQFAWIAPPALLGTLVMSFRGRRKELVIALVVITQMTGLMIFFVVARYRIAAMPALLIAAAVGLHVLWEQIRDRRLGLAAASLGVLLLGTWIAAAPKLHKPFDDEYFKLGYAYHVSGDLPQAEASYQRALSINDANISAHKNLAQLYQRNGRSSDAQPHWERVYALGEQRGLPRYVQEARHALDAIEIEASAPRAP
jgi:4-amino-4-deoxy-L-arabinose transferase-like glycosyltransferase